MKIDNEIISILGKSRIEGNLLYLPPDKLDRKIYVKVNDALTSIGLVWNKKQKCHISDSDIEDKLDEIISTGEYNSLKEKKNLLNFFPTPKNIVSQMIELAELNKNDYVLEPSFGRANILEEILKITVNVDGIEIDKENYDYVMSKFNCGMKNCDFLNHVPERVYDKIIMNPPFSNFREILHINHAWKFLRKDGILVSICSPSPFFRTNKLSLDFMEFLNNNDVEIIDLPEGSFKSSGTSIRTKILKIRKL